jgi:ABC-2 type transport system ATP-binding protein
MNHTLEMRNISKSFAEKPIYQNVNFHFDKGCYCIIGPNGVGKTILLEMLAGVIHQDEGVIDITALGSNFSIAYKHKLVYVPGNSIFYPFCQQKNIFIRKII